jgi:tRNA threonylcarbamoyladenosine biosynthesis protein TsaB
VKILALDTSGDTCSVAVVEGQELLMELNFRHNRQLTERLPGIVEFALSQAGVTLEELDAFAVGLGPGSFTGVRVGVTMVKTWAEVLGKRVIGVSSLDALARSVSGAGIAVVAVVPSRKDEVIAAFYKPDRPNPVSEPVVLPTADVIAHASAALEVPRMLVLGECAHWIAPSSLAVIRAGAPRAFHVARLGQARLRVHGPDDPAILAPLYIAPPPIRAPREAL